MSALEGYLGVLVAIVAWGTYPIPLKKYPATSPVWFQIWMSMGIAVSSLLVGLLRGFPTFAWGGIVSGAVWTVGATLSFSAVQHEGLAGASARWMGTGILVSFLLGVFALGESVSFALAIPGVLLLLVGLVMASLSSHAPGATSAKPVRPWDYWRSFVAGCIFSTYLLPMKWAQVEPLDFIAPMGVGILLGALVSALVFRPQGTRGLRLISMGCGVAWNLANLGSLVAVQTIGFAIGFPLTQLALLVSIAWGVFLFKESSGPGERKVLGFAAVLLLGGAALLGLSHLG